MNKEDYFISQFRSSFIGDDGAFVDGMVISKDLFCEDIHFKLDWMSLKQIATKSVLVNFSDAYAMNAKPKYLLLGIEIPKYFSKKDLKKLAESFKKTASKHNCQIIGGDTVAGDKLNISITVISKTKKPIFRKGIKNKDLLAYTGDIGSSKKDLEKALKNRSLDKNSKFIKPRLRYKFIQKANRYIHSCMDISDGLGFELERLSKINNIGFEFTKSLKKDVMCSGEEYELLFSIDKKDKQKIKKIAKKTKTKVSFFAKAVRSKRYNNDCKPHHF
jgi:thiamine-monophosphate kinase